MKKAIAWILALVCVFALAACAEKAPTPTEPQNTTPQTTAPQNTKPTNTEPSVTVMSYAEYLAAEVNTQVVVDTYVQAHQSWWEKDGQGVITCYTQDENGAYFLYNMACSKEDAEKLVAGTKIRVTGYKSEWEGEVEITDATFEILEGSYTAPALDVTALLGTDGLVEKLNQFVSFKGMTIEASIDPDVAFLYNWNGSGSHDANSDLYFNASIDGKTYSFCVESYLCGNDSAVYKAVENLKVGDTVDLEGFLYWYKDNAQPHITSVTVK